MAFYSLFGGAMGYVQAKASNPTEVQQAERAWDMDFASGDYDDISAVNRKRYEHAKTVIQQFQGMREALKAQYGQEPPPVNPMEIMMAVEPSMLVTESQLTEKAKWFSELLDTEEGINASKEDRMLMSTFVETYAMLAQGQSVEIAAAQASIQSAANTDPNAVAMQEQQMVAQAQAQEQAVAQESEKEQMNQTIEGEKKALELAENERQREHEVQLAEINASKGNQSSAE